MLIRDELASWRTDRGSDWYESTWQAERLPELVYPEPAITTRPKRRIGKAVIRSIRETARIAWPGIGFILAVRLLLGVVGL